MSTEKISVLEAMLSQYEKATTFTSENTFDLKNYFTTYLPDGVDSKMSAIRILPVNGSPFQEVHVHSAKVDGKNRKFTCISHLNDEPCPFCEAREKLLASGEKSDEELAKSYKARLMYVVKVIDREKEEEGPKFWRFPINYKKDGVMDKIMSSIKMLNGGKGENVTDIEDGRDLTLSIVRVKNPRGGTYPAVNNVGTSDKKPVSTDAELSKKWLEDKKTWQDVYSVKDYDYLKLIVMGEIPAWSKKLKTFVAKSSLTTEDEEDTTESLDSKVSMGADAQTKSETPVVTEVVEDTEKTTYTAPVDNVEDEEDDDLPF
tara:strand:+ start:32518 stop:33465 length:948 start_codon:yes stop_codon:yes gene_type:complete